ncbi:MAG: DNA mismatch repair protein MutS [Crocinitomicaceae bacterium]
MSRLFVFLMMAICSYAFYPSGQIITGILVVGFALFLFLVGRYADVKAKRNFQQTLVNINKKELLALNGNLAGFKTGTEFVTDEHYFNQDIDLFGEGSIFQSIKRTGTRNGEVLLAAWLNSNSIKQVKEKQIAIEELKTKTDWRQEFQATGEIIEKEVELNAIVAWAKKYTSKIPRVYKWAPAVFSVLSIAVLAAFFMSFVPGKALAAWFFIGLGITAAHLKHITKLANDGGRVQETFRQYSKLILQIEQQELKSDLLQDLQQDLKESGVEVSQILGQLSKEFSNLDQRNNVFFAMLANGFFLWDLRYARRIEAWIEQHELSLEKWFNVVSQFDAYNSMANFSYNHPKYVVPTLSADDKTTIQAEALGHPLLNEDKRVDNDLSMNTEDFLIITGANMAGKSTFLRTVALNIVMANCGMPVCAKSFTYKPIKLISSMRTSDSLQNDESYFFSELKRLKFIVDEIKTDTYFIILDEILKGTNSKDKAEGSKKFVERLVASNSTGLIATHDLSLCVLEKELPQITNHYFDAEIVDNELFFDYTFKDGVCQNMNASFLLKKMEIV